MVSAYYVKRLNIATMNTPNQASWVVKKVFSMRRYLATIGSWQQVVQGGKFSIRKTYKLLKGEHNLGPWSSIVCANTVAPRACFITWLVLQGKVRTRDLLVKWGVTTDTICALCSAQNESIPHIFFNCTYSLEIWNSILKWLKYSHQVGSWEEEWLWVSETCKTHDLKAKALKLCFAEMVYHIWLERNARIIHQSEMPAPRILHKIQCHVLLRSQNNDNLRNLFLINC